MPHQCLKCGTLFAEGTTTILRGCPDCRGTRFFYTQEPLTLAEREQLLHQSERDLPALVEQLIGPREPPPPPGGPPGPSGPVPRLEVPEAFDRPRAEGELLPGGRLLVKLPKSVHARVRRATVGWDYDLAPGPSPATAAPEGLSDVSHVEPAAPNAAPPETVRIPQLGQYEIDVQRLLERSPIVVHKDGTYLIHLPSLFDVRQKPGRND